MILAAMTILNGCYRTAQPARRYTLENVQKEEEMKKMLVLIMLAMVLGLFMGCTSLSHYENKFSRYASGFSPKDQEKIVVKKGDQTNYYFCLNYGTEGLNCWGWYCWEYDCDKNNHILKKNEYWIEKTASRSDNDRNFKEFKEKINR